MESMNEALIECIRAAGGSKQVGPLLWPEKTPEAAQRLLLDCLNDDRPAHLTPEQVLLILKLARAKGHHGGVNYMLHQLGYAPTLPIEPRDEAADLMRRVIEAQEVLSVQVARLAALQPMLKAVA